MFTRCLVDVCQINPYFGTQAPIIYPLSKQPSGMWQDVSTNPDDPAVMAHRSLQLQEAKSRNIESLRAFMSTFFSDLNVVDFGYANHSPETANIAGESTHSFVSEAAKSVVGVDVVGGFDDSSSVGFCRDLFGSLQCCCKVV